MTAARIERDDRLQQYFDGELSADEEADVRALLETDEEFAARLEVLGRFRELMQVGAEDIAAELDASALYDRVEKGIAEDIAAGRGEGLKLVDGGASRPPHKEKVVEPWRVAIPVLTFAAAAAVLFFFLQPTQEPMATQRGLDANGTGTGAEGDLLIGTERDTGAEGNLQIEGHEDDAHFVMVEAPHGTEVEEVDFGENTGTVFAVEGEAGEPIAVVWINDELEEAIQ